MVRFFSQGGTLWENVGGGRGTVVWREVAENTLSKGLAFLCRVVGRHNLMWDPCLSVSVEVVERTRRREGGNQRGWRAWRQKERSEGGRSSQPTSDGL